MLFVGPLIPLFWTSGDVCSGFQRQSGFLACYGFLRFISDATPASLLAAIIVAEPFLIHILSHISASTGGTRSRNQVCGTVCTLTVSTTVAPLHFYQIDFLSVLDFHTM